MSSGTRLVILTSADTADATGSLLESLNSWCAAGMLAEVVWLPAAALADRRADAECQHYFEGTACDTRLGAALSRYHRGEVWLAALRHPRQSSDSRTVKETRHTEDRAHESLKDLLGSGIELRSLTVKVAAADSNVNSFDCTPSWDFHLIHDSNVEAHESLSRAVAADREPLGLCAMVALCASGGWRDAEQTLQLEPDRFDGLLKRARFVHCQMRVLHTPPVPLSAMQTSPPWPLPVTAGVERAQPDAVPPLSLAAHLSNKGGFVCARPSAVGEPSRWSETMRLLSHSLRKIDPPPAKTASEAALERLAGRTGELTDQGDRVTRLRFDPSLDLGDLVRHVERSDFLVAGRAPSVTAASNPWSTVRETMFGLVDGSGLPTGATHPTRETGGINRRLLWTDPLGIAPPHAPGDAQDILSGVDSRLRTAANRRAAEPPAADSSSSQDGDQSVYRFGPAEKPTATPDGEQGPASEWAPDGEQGADTDTDDATSADGDQSADTGSGADSDQRADGAQSADSGSSADAYQRAAAGTHREVVEHGDTLMERLAEAIARSLGKARRGFKQNCATVSVKAAYDAAVAARRRAMRWAALVPPVLIVVIAYAIDRFLWPFMQDTWEFVTPFDAVPYDWRWWVVILLALLAAALMLAARVVQMLEKLRALDAANAERRRLAEHAAHYGSEMLRLYSIAQQFCDHRLIITEFLHRPFGHYADAGRTRLSAADLAFTSPPPHSMLVAYADADPDKLDARHHQQQESAVEPGWLSDVYDGAYTLWSDRYRNRVLGEFQDPDHDTTAGSAVVHRNRRDGSEIYGARTDFARSVVADPGNDASGWAIRQAATARAIGIDDTDSLLDDYLALFGPVESVHGWQPGVSAANFFGFSARPHDFDWDELLSPGADRPAERPPPQSERHFLDAPQDRSLIVAWHLELTGPVRPQDQAGWQGIVGDDPSDDPSTSASRSVV